MKMELSSERYRAVPIQIIGMEDGLLLKRGLVELRVRGEGAVAVQHLLEATPGEGRTLEELRTPFPENVRPNVDRLLEHLIRRRFLVPVMDGGQTPEETESATDIFYWHFGEQREQHLDDRRLLLIGVNSISRRLAASLHASGLRSVEVRDYPLLRNLRLFDEQGALRPGAWPSELEAPVPHTGGVEAIDPQGFDCLVATSDFGGMQLLRAWNEFCVLHKRPFLPVVLQDMVGYVGPLVMPGETACYECFRLRRNTHVADPQSRHLIESAAFQGQATVGFLPPMASMLGDVAAVELLKLFTLAPPLWRVGTVLEVNLMAPDLSARAVLKLPRCPVCTPLAERPSMVAVRSGTVRPGGSA
ncbi:MAG TPA: TOMM precursor leader peptide-binding protein [Archangium sp.]|nr:TOMM precursor leader peptide-binding protein [Archangium sp.]